MTEDGRLFDEWMAPAAKARADRVKRRIQEENNVNTILEAYKPEPTEFDDDLAEMRSAEAELESGPRVHSLASPDLSSMYRDLALQGSVYIRNRR